MKSVRVLITWVFLLAAIAGVVLGAFELKERFGHGPEEEEEEAAAAEEEKKPLDEDAVERLGVKLAPLAAATWRERISAFGRVVDPLPLVMLQNERLVAEAALKASEAEVARSRKLFEGGENIARRNLEQAEALVAADRLKLRAVEQRFLLEWGPEIGGEHAALIDGILAGTLVLLRAELASARVPEKPPAGAHVLVAGLDSPQEASVIGPAPSVDVKSQAVAWFLKLEKPARPLSPGLSVEVQFASGEKEESGVIIPAQAVLHFEGEAWVFTEGWEKGRFERRQVRLDHALSGGWFAAGEFKPGGKVVTTGAASLLADELQAQIEGD